MKEIRPDVLREKSLLLPLNYWSQVVYSCVFKALRETNPPITALALPQTHKHTCLINTSVSLHITFSLLTPSFEQTQTDENAWQMEMNWKWLRSVPRSLLLHNSSTFGVQGALRGWNINTNEVASLTTQTQHLHRAWTPYLYKRKHMPHKFLLEHVEIAGLVRQRRHGGLAQLKWRRCLGCSRVCAQITQQRSKQETGSDAAADYQPQL